MVKLPIHSTPYLNSVSIPPQEIETIVLIFTIGLHKIVLKKKIKF